MKTKTVINVLDTVKLVEGSDYFLKHNNSKNGSVINVKILNLGSESLTIEYLDDNTSKLFTMDEFLYKYKFVEYTR